MTQDIPAKERIVVFAPEGPNLKIVRDVLTKAGLTCRVCDAVVEFCRLLDEGAGVGIILNEILTRENVACIRDFLQSQPPWSDLAIILFMRDLQIPYFEIFGSHRNIITLEMPIHTSALVGLLRSLLAARQRQYENRDVIHELEITKEKFLKSKTDLENKNKELEGVICDLRKTQESLHAMTEELARSNKNLEQFAYMASHDLQEPLRNVTGFVTLLRDRYQDKLDEKAKEFIGIIFDGATWMEKMIDALLEYSRIGTKGNLMEPVEVGGVLNAALTNLKTSVAETGAAITYDKLPVVTADGVLLTQLFQNLIGNAIKFRKPDQPPQIHIGCQKQQDSWLFSIRDNGIGIDAKDFDRIFVVFSRLHAREEYPGSGIGLAVCKKIVELHGGRIRLESELGKGTTFYFTIPASNE